MRLCYTGKITPCDAAALPLPMSTHRIALYLSPRHPCSYLRERIATNAFVDPRMPGSNALYASLIKQGFRRSGRYVYRPACENCKACLSARVPVALFSPSRGQRRVARRNSDLTVRSVSPRYRDEHFALYRRYLRVRHDDGAMSPDDPDTYIQFLSSEWSDTRFHEFRAGGRLIAVAAIDQVANGLSAVYTFFDPEEHRRSPGTFAVLYQIDLARQQGLDYVYLGYWIEQSAKMRYKMNFRPLEIYRNGEWTRLPAPKRR